MNVKDLYLPDGKSLHKVVVGQSGSGKSVFLEHGAKAFLKQNTDPNFRMVYFSPKNEGFTDLLKKDRRKRIQGLVYDVPSMLKSMEKNVLTVFYPDSAELELTMDETIDALFDLRDANEDLKTTLVIDDAQVFLSSRKRASDAQNRLALLGRSRKINAIYVSHALILNKALEAQVDSLFFFTLPAKVHWKSGEERYGFNPESYVEPLREVPYSFVSFDVRSGSARLMNPVSL